MKYFFLESIRPENLNVEKVRKTKNTLVKIKLTNIKEVKKSLDPSLALENQLKLPPDLIGPRGTSRDDSGFESSEKSS